MPKNLNLRDYRKNIYSQTGEDGVVAKIMEIFEQNGIEATKWCVEFGAWDGIYCSNTFNLVKNGNWNAVLIEQDEQKYRKLIENSKIYKNIRPIKAHIEKSKDHANSLDNILSKTELPTNFDILSVDIDSYDVEVWKSLEKYAPKLVIMEIDNSLPPDVLVMGTASNQGSSFACAVEVAAEKGYELICDTGNLFFVRDELVHVFDIEERFLKNPSLLFNTRWVNKELNILQRLADFLPNRLYMTYLRYFKKL